MDLTKSQKSEDSDDLGVELIDTPDSHYKGYSCSTGYINLTSELSCSSCVNLSEIVLGILGIILLSSL